MADRENEWVDDKLSDELPLIRARGEGPNVDFKREFPKQVSDLAKEIAGFATTDGGIIYLGIEDNGDSVGLENCDDAEERDNYVNRIEGICSNSVKPAITPDIKWAVEDGSVVLAVIVSKGPEPLYYSKDTPYVRHITSSRPADPNEVIRYVRSYLSKEQTENDESAQHSENADFSTESERSPVIPTDLQKEARELDRIVTNIKSILSKGSIRDLQFKISEMGQKLILLSKDPSLTDPDIETKVWGVGMELHSIKNRKMYIDGGQSLRIMVQEIIKQNANLQEIVNQ